eukprot:6188797-Pleurochrysis_carterae.AAC.3
MFAGMFGAGHFHKGVFALRCAGSPRRAVSGGCDDGARGAVVGAARVHALRRGGRRAGDARGSRTQRGRAGACAAMARGVFGHRAGIARGSRGDRAGIARGLCGEHAEIMRGVRGLYTVVIQMV